MTAMLRGEGYATNRKRVRQLMHQIEMLHFCYKQQSYCMRTSFFDAL